MRKGKPNQQPAIKIQFMRFVIKSNKMATDNILPRMNSYPYLSKDPLKFSFINPPLFYSAYPIFKPNEDLSVLFIIIRE